MRRCLTQVVVAAAAMSLSLPAFAQSHQEEPNCPPGAWFCAKGDVVVQPPVQVQPPVRPAPVRPQLPQLQEEPQQVAPAVVDEPADEPPMPPPPPVRRARRPPPPAAPPPVIYQQVPTPPPTVIIVTPGYGGGYGYGYHRPVRPVPPAPVAPKPRWQSEFGFNLRVEGVAMGHTQAIGNTAGMGGVGLSLRYRPVPAFAFDLGVDVLAGNDYNGFQRVEVPISLNGLLYLNPRSRVQVYLEGGANISRAQVRSDFAAPQLKLVDDGAQYGANYTYFGGQGGGGLEFRLSKRTSLNLDVLGFVRKRIDDDKNTPEFIDYKTGRTTNSSGGALVRGGITFWW